MPAVQRPRPALKPLPSSIPTGALFSGFSRPVCEALLTSMGRQKDNSSRDEIHEKNSRIHLDRLQNKYTNCKKINILAKLLKYKRNWIQRVNRMPRNTLPRVMKHYSPTGRRNHGRPLTLKKTGIKLYNTLALPVLLYGSETWTIKARDARRITAAEMKYMRRTA